MSFFTLLRLQEAEFDLQDSEGVKQVIQPQLKKSYVRELLTLLKFLLFKTTEKCHPIKNHSV